MPPAALGRRPPRVPQTETRLSAPTLPEPGPAGETVAGEPPAPVVPARPASRRLGHVEAFEGMRGIAVGIVVIAHLNILVPVPEYLVVPGGVVSLNSFFVLSGFLITTLLLKEHASNGRISAPAFYRRRALRLFPALLAMLAAHTVYAAVAGLDAVIQIKSVLAAAFYFMNWRLALTGNDLGSTQVTEGLQHIWSLSFEEQFYLVWPWVTMLGLTYARRLRTVVIAIVAVMIIVSLHRANQYASGASWYPIFIRTDTRFDSFLPGVLLAHIWFRGREPKKFVPLAGWIALAILVVCLFTARIDEPFLYYGGMTLIDVSCAVLILAILDGRWRANRFFELKMLVRLGTVSYALYLWHLPVMFALRRWTIDINLLTGEREYSVSPWITVPASLAISLAFTLASWYLLEKPAMAWKRRIEGRPVDSLAPDDRSGAVPSGATATEARTSAFSARSRP